VIPLRKTKGGKALFNRKEINMLHDPYFKVIREEEQFIEIQSINTGHCWNIFKNQFEQVYKIKLYHKHKRSDTYYHEHRMCRNVAEAIGQIKSHDDYVLEQAKQKESKVVCATKPERHLTVHESSGYMYKRTPTILLKGEWLRDMGFDIGDKICVKFDEGKLVIGQEKV